MIIDCSVFMEMNGGLIKVALQASNVSLNFLALVSEVLVNE